MRKSCSFAVVALGLFAQSAIAGPTPAEKCEASKNKIAGAYYACLEKAEATAILKNLPADYSKCTVKFDEKWDATETAGGVDCPDSVLTATMNAYLTAQAAETAAIIAGTAGIPVCGDNAVNAVGEQCDGSDLDGTTCASLRGTGGTLACDVDCTLDATDCFDCPGGSTAFAGACWLLGASAPSAATVASCDTACSSIGLTCDEASLQAVGSAGSDSDCRDVVDVVDPGGAPHAIFASSPQDLTACGLASDYAAGCVLGIGFPLPGFDSVARMTFTGSGTLCSADIEGGSCSPSPGTVRRACACNP